MLEGFRIKLNIIEIKGKCGFWTIKKETSGILLIANFKWYLLWHCIHNQHWNISTRLLFWLIQFLYGKLYLIVCGPQVARQLYYAWSMGHNGYDWQIITWMSDRSWRMWLTDDSVFDWQVQLSPSSTSLAVWSTWICKKLHSNVSHEYAWVL